MDRKAEGSRKSAAHNGGPNTERDREVALDSPARGIPADASGLAELRELLLGGERREIEELRRRLDARALTPDELAEHLPEAIALRSSRDGELARALTPALEEVVGESVRRNPQEVATAILPALGPAIRQSIAGAMRRNRSWLAWFIPVVLVLGIGAVFLVRSNQRWSRAVSILEQAPGIVVVSADRNLGGWRFTGLRDPLAGNPSALLAAAGFDTSSIEERWESYVSTQPSLVLARAHRLLSAPHGVRFTLEADTLVVRGQASRRWRERTAAIAPTLPGVSHADLSGVTDAVPAELDSLIRQAADVRVLFSPGSDSLGAPGRAAADAIASLLSRLTQAAAAEGYAVTTMLVGRADTLGTDTIQLDLGRRRAMTVRDALVARGVSSSQIDVRSLGSTDPLPADDPNVFGRLKRSVSVEVTVADTSSFSALREPGGTR